MPAVQAIFFDIGDTLVFDDPPLRDRLASAMQAIGLTVDKLRWPAAFRDGEQYAVARYVEGKLWEDPDSMREAMSRVLAALDLAPLDDPTWQAFGAALSAIPFTRSVQPEAIPLLLELKQRGFTVGAISDWEATLPTVLAELGLAPCFDALAVSESVGVTKPHPRLFQTALQSAKAEPETSLHVGDWYELDVCGAKAARMQTLLFDWAGRCPHADCPRVTTFGELTDTLLALPRPI